MTVPIYFAHANGFPSPCYRQLFASLPADFALTYIDKVGHNADFPITDNWDTLCEELLMDIQKQHKQAVIGIGHSLGGVLMYLAASKAPHLFKGIILLDSPIYGSMKGMMIRLAKWSRRVEKITPAARTKYRKSYWPDRAAALAYFQTKPLFQRFDKHCLLDYVEYGLVDCEKGVCLLFDKKVEYQIFKTLPDNLARYRTSKRPPVVLLYGQESTLFKERDLIYMQKRLGFDVIAVEGGHLFPMEKPQAAGKAINSVLLAKFDK